MNRPRPLTSEESSNVTWEAVEGRVLELLASSGASQPDLSRAKRLLDQAGTCEGLAELFKREIESTAPQFGRIRERSEELERVFRSGTAAILKSIQQEIRWGGLLFNPDEIQKAASGLLASMSPLIDSLVSDAGQLGEIGMYFDLMRAVGADDPLTIESIEQVDESLTLLANTNFRISAYVQWTGRFNQSLLTMGRFGSARALLAVSPPGGWPSDSR